MILKQLDSYEPPTSRWSDWGRYRPVLSAYDFMGLRHILLDRATEPVHKDELLTALVCIGQHRVDRHATMAVVVCLLPGLRCIARRYRDLLGSDDVWAEVLAGTWTHASTYDTARRPRRIAANLLWDTTAHVARVVRRERAWRDHADLDDQLDVSAVHDAGLGAPVLADAVTAGVLTQLDATLVEATRLHGVGLADAAMLTGMSYEAAKKRRRRAEVAWLCWCAPELSPESVLHAGHGRPARRVDDRRHVFGVAHSWEPWPHRRAITPGPPRAGKRGPHRRPDRAGGTRRR